MNPELFPVEAVASLSPKLLWMQKHGIITYYHAPGHCPPSWFAGFQRWRPKRSGVDFFATETAENGDSRVGEGETEDAALAELMTCSDARSRNMKLWNEEGA